MSQKIRIFLNSLKQSVFLFVSFIIALNLSIVYVIGATVQARVIEIIYQYLIKPDQHHLLRQLAIYFPFDEKEQTFSLNGILFLSILLAASSGLFIIQTNAVNLKQQSK